MWKEMEKRGGEEEVLVSGEVEGRREGNGDKVGLSRKEVGEDAEADEALVAGWGRVVEEEGLPAQSFQDLRQVTLRL